MPRELYDLDNAARLDALESRVAALEAAPAPEPTPSPEPDPGGSPYDLGAVPFAVNLPEAPRSPAVIDYPAGVHTQDITLGTDEIHVLGVGAVIEGNVRGNGLRCRIVGGTIRGDIQGAHTDLLVENVRIEGRSNDLWGGTRVAFVRVTARMERHGLFLRGAPATDLILSSCDLSAGHAEAGSSGARIHSVDRLVVVDSRIVCVHPNPGGGLRVHDGAEFGDSPAGQSGRVYVSGCHFDTGPGAQFTSAVHLWVEDSHWWGPWINLGPLTTSTLYVIEVRGNRLHGPSVIADFGRPWGPNDVREDNQHLPGESPPSFSGGADH